MTWTVLRSAAAANRANAHCGLAISHADQGNEDSLYVQQAEPESKGHYLFSVACSHGVFRSSPAGRQRMAVHSTHSTSVQSFTSCHYQGVNARKLNPTNFQISNDTGGDKDRQAARPDSTRALQVVCAYQPAAVWRL